MTIANIASKEQSTTYKTYSGILIVRKREKVIYESAIDHMISMLDSRRGAIFSSNYEYPGRYTRWDTGILDPPLVISSRQRCVIIEALNDRGAILCHRQDHA